MGDLRDRTIFPPSEAQVLHELEAFIATLPVAKVRSPEGHEAALPDEVYDALRHVVRALRQGQAVTIAPHHTVLTTQEAADLLGISRTTFIKLLERDDIPHTKHGRHRRVTLDDVMAYKHRAQERTRRALDDLVTTSDEADLYDDSFGHRPPRR